MHEKRQELTATRGENRRIGSGISSGFEVISHGLADQFAQIAAGIPRPVAIGCGQIGVDSDSQFLLACGAGVPLPRRSSRPGMGPLGRSCGRLLRRSRLRRVGCFGLRRIVRYQVAEDAADAGHRRLTHEWPAIAVRSRLRNRRGPSTGSDGRPCPRSSRREYVLRPELPPIHDSVRRPPGRPAR